VHTGSNFWAGQVQISGRIHARTPGMEHPGGNCTLAADRGTQRWRNSRAL